MGEGRIRERNTGIEKNKTHGRQAVETGTFNLIWKQKISNETNICLNAEEIKFKKLREKSFVFRLGLP